MTQPSRLKLRSFLLGRDVACYWATLLPSDINIRSLITGGLCYGSMEVNYQRRLTLISSLSRSQRNINRVIGTSCCLDFSKHIFKYMETRCLVTLTPEVIWNHTCMVFRCHLHIFLIWFNWSFTLNKLDACISHLELARGRWVKQQLII